MIPPTEPIIPFESEEQKLEMFRRWHFVSQKATEFKQLYYRGFYSDTFVPCEVIGLLEKTFIVVLVNGQQHCIHPDYLAEMQPTKSERDVLGL